MQMRKSEREVKDIKAINEILRECDVCHVGFNDNGKVYIVPLNFGFKEENGKYTLYFHGNKVGRKMDLAASEEYAGFEMDTGYELKDSDTACNHSTYFKSIIGTGKVRILETYEEKREAFKYIMIQATGSDDFPYVDKAIENTGLFKIEVEELSCKVHNYNN